MNLKGLDMTLTQSWSESPDAEPNVRYQLYLVPRGACWSSADSLATCRYRDCL